MKTVKTLTLLALLTTLSLAQKEALIVGVSDYMGTRSDLSGVNRDVPRMERLFKSWGFNVTVLKNAESMSLESNLANYANLKADDNFIFYYSGHGFHVKDDSGDEPDGEDETLVLSDGKKNRLFLDDALFGYLNSIKAKKMILLDSCHSGTAFKAFGDQPKPKSITENEVSSVMRTKSFRPQESKIAKGEYIVFSASQDKEESLDTSNGGLFTNAFLNQFQNGGRDKPLMNLRQKMENEIVDYAKRADAQPHHPQLSASSTSLKYSTINKFFKAQESHIATKKISIMGKKTFRENELLSFKIDTHGNSGYLTIFSVESGEPFIMAQTKQKVSGVLNFQEDFNIQPPIECYKSCNNCQQERSVVYVILSAKPISKSLMMSRGLKVENDNKNMRAFRERTSDAFEPILAKFETTIY